MVPGENDASKLWTLYLKVSLMSLAASLTISSVSPPV